MTGNAKVSICSGQPVDDMSAQLRTLSLRGYLTKPYIPETFPRMIDRSLHDLAYEPASPCTDDTRVTVKGAVTTELQESRPIALRIFT